MKFKYIVENKPYLTKKELSVLLDKDGKNLDKKIQQLLNKKELIPLKKGLYISRFYLLQKPKLHHEFIANVMCYPSYLSTEYILQKENIIPEAVYSYTSITTKTTRKYTNQLGNFIYQSIKKELFIGFENIRFVQNYMVKEAIRAKALFDWLYLKTFKNSIKQELKKDLRINWEVIKKSDLIEFKKYVDISGVKKMQEIYSVMEKLL